MGDETWPEAVPRTQRDPWVPSAVLREIVREARRMSVFWLTSRMYGKRSL